MNDLKIKIFETKLNTIWESEGCYYLQHNKKGVVATLDKNEKIIISIITSINVNGNFHYTTTSNGFIVMDKLGKYKHSLHQFIYSICNDIPIKEIQKHHFEFANNDKLDYRINNLVYYEVPQIYKEDNLIYIKDSNGNICFTDYKEGLLDLINSKDWCFNIGTNIFSAYEGRVSLSQLCYCYFYEGANIANIDDVLKLYKHKCKSVSDKRREWLTIDHKNCNRQDNRKANLQLIPQYLNNRRSNYTTKLKSGQFYIPMEDGELAGRFDYKNDPLSNWFKKITGIRPFDIQILHDKPGTEKSITNLVKMIKNDELPENAWNIKTSWLMYGLTAWLFYTFTDCISKNQELDI